MHHVLFELLLCVSFAPATIYSYVINHILYSLLQILYILHTLSLSSLLMCCPVPEMSCSCFCWVLVTDLSGVFCSFVACCVLEMFLAWPVQTFLAFAGTATEQPFLAWNQTCAWWPGTSGTGWINWFQGRNVTWLDWFQEQPNKALSKKREHAWYTRMESNMYTKCSACFLEASKLTF